jgi:hypothetical protein
MIYLVRSPSVGESTGSVSFEESQIPSLTIAYNASGYTFDFAFKSWFLRVKPFIIYNGTYYDLKTIIPFIKNQFPNIKFATLIQKAKNICHYGFNLTSLPLAVSNRIDLLGFKIVDMNFPLSEFQIENIDADGQNITRLHILKANIGFSFEDLQPLFTVIHLNATYVIVGNVTGKSDLTLDPITFSSSGIQVVGFTQAIPCTFWDLWNASNVNGWNVVWNHQNKNTQYQFDCKIRIGNAETATWFADTEKDVAFSTGIALSYAPLIRVYTNAHFRSGVLEDASLKVGSKGCAIRSLESSTASIYLLENGLSGTGSFELYDSVLDCPNIEHRIYLNNNDKIYGCLLINNVLPRICVLDMYNTVLSKGTYGMYACSGTLDKIFMNTFTYAFLAYQDYAPFNISNVVIRNCNYIFRSERISLDQYLTNVESSTWTSSWASTGDAKLYRQYTFDLKVFYSNSSAAENANVTLKYYGQGGGIVGSWFVNGSGKIPTQRLTSGFYNRTGASTIYDYNPYNLTIVKDGYLTYTQNVTLWQKSDWEICLLPGAVSSNGDAFMMVGFLLMLIGLIIGFGYAVSHSRH